MNSSQTVRVMAAILTVLVVLCAARARAQEAASRPETRQAHKSGGLFPKDAAGLEEMARQAIEEDNALRLLQTTILLRRQQPYEPRNWVNMVRAYAMMDKPTSAYNYMLKMQQQGLSFDFDQIEETAKLRGTEVYTYLNDLMIRAGDPAGEAEPAFTLSHKYAFPAALAWDESRGRFLVGTGRDGDLLAVGEDGRVEKLLEADEDEGPWAITDIAVDQAHDRLWLSSTAAPGFEGYGNGNAGQSGLFGFELESLTPVGRYLVSQDDGPRELGAIAVDPEGDVYVADRQQAELYRKKAGADQLAPFLADKELSGFRDMTITADGKRIYLADPYKGILVADPENEQAALLEGPESLNLGGIEGLFHAGNELIIIQSGIEPQRLMALKLDASGGKVEEVRPMAIALEWFDRPSGGTIRGDSLYYFADAQPLQEGAKGKEVTVLRTALDAGSTIVAPDMRKFEEETLSKARNN